MERGRVTATRPGTVPFLLLKPIVTFSWASRPLNTCSFNFPFSLPRTLNLICETHLDSYSAFSPPSPSPSLIVCPQSEPSSLFPSAFSSQQYHPRLSSGKSSLINPLVLDAKLPLSKPLSRCPQVSPCPSLFCFLAAHLVVIPPSPLSHPLRAGLRFLLPPRSPLHVPGRLGLHWRTDRTCPYFLCSGNSRDNGVQLGVILRREVAVSAFLSLDVSGCLVWVRPHLQLLVLLLLGCLWPS